MEISANGPTVITSQKILAVEGKDEINFFNKLLKHQNINCQVLEVGGKGQFPNKLPSLIRSPGFARADGSFAVTHLAVIRDKNGDNAFDSVTGILRDNDLVSPEKEGQFSNGKPKVGVFIMPGKKIKGTMLEDLCLETVGTHPAMKCVNEFATCVSALKTRPKNISKAKVQVFKAQVFLATQPETVGSVGLGAQKGYWDLDSPCLDDLKAFLENMR